MGIKQKLMGFAVEFLLERPARGKSYTELGLELDNAGQKILLRLQNKKMTEFNHRVLSHITGIERWGQSRLRSMLGGPLLQDEYDGYRPARDIPWDGLIEEFRATRAETVQLVQSLTKASVDPTTTVSHNDFGPITVRAWLRYLQTHASREILQIR